MSGPSSLVSWLRGNRGFLAFVLLLGVFRTAVADWNPVPSASMRPTIQEGDVVLINRTAYDLKLPLTDVSLQATGEPQRGDIVTFISPADGVRLIKRIVALPGDVVAVDHGRLWLNGEPARYAQAHEVTEPLEGGLMVEAWRATEHAGGAAHAVQYLPGLGTGVLAHMPPLTIPAGHYFMMGDNRDNSGDSRVFGPVPRRLLIGRAHHVLVSADFLGLEGTPWVPQWARFGMRLQ
jgi:signal peptidase I